MRSSRQALYLFIAMLLAVGGLFGSLGAAAQDQQVEVEQQVDVAHPGGDLPGDPQIELVKVADGFIDPVNIQSANDGSGRLFVVERVGYIRIIDGEGNVLDEPFLDITSTVKIDFLEQGLLGLAFHPDYENNGRFFVFYSDWRTNGDMFVVEYGVSEDDPNLADPDSAQVLMAIEDPYVNHNGGTMEFGPDGYLYITVGDGGLAGDPYNAAQGTGRLLGSILRIDVDTEGDRDYAIPDLNPFTPGEVLPSDVANQRAVTDEYYPAAAEEIWVYGLRNAWQFSFDPETGDMYIADVGQVAWEEINFIPADEVPTGGHNFGWDFLEGAHCYPPDEDECARVGVPPVAEYSHEFGCSITGLGVYHGEAESLDGIYFASDFCSGRVWGLERNDAGEWEFEELLDTELLVTGSGSGETGEVYATSCVCQFNRDYNPFENATGAVWEVVPADEVPEGAETAPTAEPADVTPEAVTDEGLATPEATPEG